MRGRIFDLTVIRNGKAYIRVIVEQRTGKNRFLERIRREFDDCRAYYVRSVLIPRLQRMGFELQPYGTAVYE